MYSKKYYEDNKEKVAIQGKKYREDNKEKVAMREKKYREENKDKIAIRKKKYREENPEIRKAQKQNRRARKAGNGGSFTAKEWKELCKFYNHRCLCCGEKKKLTADHIIPVAKGGTSYIENIQPLCGSCNSSKGTKTTDYRTRIIARQQLVLM